MASVVEFAVGQPRYIPNIHLDPEPRFLWARPSLDTISRYDEESVPKHAFFKGGTKTIPDLVPISARLSMCREAREVIESLEPGVHQLFPAEVTRYRSTKPIYRLDGRILD